MIENYLKKLQELQRDALNSGIFIEIENRYDSENNYPWLVITAKTAGWSDDTDKDGYLNIQMYGNMYNDEVKNEHHQAEVYAKVETFVKSRLSVETDKARFMNAYERALKLQQACLFSKVTVEVHTTFCKGNYSESNLHAWTVSIDVFIEKEDNRILRRAQFQPWYEDERFYEEVKAIEEEIEKEGININK